MSPPRITLLTDFGTRDGYVGAMKAVIARSCPTAIIDDISHDTAPGDLFGASYALTYYFDIYPENTVHVVVVDPGVGSARRAMAARVDGRFLVGPDNGVFSEMIGAGAEVRELVIPQWSSHTFHGRDVFAPAAAQLACGFPFDQIGPPIVDCVKLELPPFSRERGQIIYIDHFGNLITNVSEAPRSVRIGEHDVELKRTYADVEPRALLALMNSRGLLEIAVRDGNAAEQLRVRRGAAVHLTY